MLEAREFVHKIHGLRTLMAIEGNATMSTTQRYIDMRPSVIRAAVDLV